MKPAMLLVAVVAALAAALLVNVLAPSGPSADDLATLDARLAALGQQLEDASRSREDLAMRVDSIQRAPSPTSAGAAFTQADIEAAVEAVLARRPDLLAGAAAEEEAVVDADAEGPQSADDYFALLLSGDLSDVMRSELWQEIRDKGLTEAVVAAFEQLARDNPDDPMVHLALGAAYLEQIQTVPQGPQSGALATLADQAFDTALELDPDNWDARFVKGIALSFWPPIFGKQAEAIDQFEILRERQKGQPFRAEHVQTYVLLGNLYQQTGKSDQAMEIWLEGYELFPDDPDLQARILGK